MYTLLLERMNDYRSMVLSCTLTMGFDNVMVVLMSESNFILCFSVQACCYSIFGVDKESSCTPPTVDLRKGSILLFYRR